MKAADIPDREPLMVVAVTCDYGREFMSADRFRFSKPLTDRQRAEAKMYGWMLDFGDEGVRYTSYTHGGPPDGGLGATRWDIGEELWEYPEKVLLAKLRALVRRGLLDGCLCGCRGDFTITDAGRAMISEHYPTVTEIPLTSAQSQNSTAEGLNTK